MLITQAGQIAILMEIRVTFASSWTWTYYIKLQSTRHDGSDLASLTAFPTFFPRCSHVVPAFCPGPFQLADPLAAEGIST